MNLAIWIRNRKQAFVDWFSENGSNRHSCERCLAYIRVPQAALVLAVLEAVRRRLAIHCLPPWRRQHPRDAVCGVGAGSSVGCGVFRPRRLAPDYRCQSVGQYVPAGRDAPSRFAGKVSMQSVANAAICRPTRACTSGGWRRMH